MPQISYRANLSAAIFPLSLSQAGRAVIVPGPDNNYDRRVDPQGEQKDAGIPQAIYLEDVIPTSNGYQSVGYKELGPTTPFTTGFKPYRVAVIDGYTYLFGQNTSATDFVYRSQDLIIWTDVTTYWGTFFGPPYVEGYLPHNNLSQATVRGTSYVFVRNGNSLCSAAGTVFTDLSGTLAGISRLDINSILASYNYLVAILNDGSIAWSSTTTPTDFTPSLVTGAGRITPEAVRGEIVAAHRCPEGFMMYTETNAIIAEYTGNARYPWKFREISNSGGHASERLIAAPQDSAVHFTVNDQGSITQISAGGTTRLAPEVSTYLRTAKGAYDLYNPSTKSIVTTPAYLFAQEIMFLANRYIVVQLANVRYTAAVGIGARSVIIYDTLLQRYGRLGDTPVLFWDDSSTIYCVTKNNKICKLTFDIEDATATWTAVLILGKFQYVRSRRLELDEVIVEGELPDLAVEVMATDNGSIPATGTALALRSGDDFVKTYDCRIEGHSHLLTLKGRFTLSTVELTFHPGGGR